MASNYNDILDQLRGIGLIVDAIEIGRLVRCKVEGDRERRGWYIVHEITTGTGDRILVGSCGIWHGDDNGAIKLEARKTELTAQQRELLRARMREDRKRADYLRKTESARAARRAAAAWSKCSPIGESDYLVRKGVGGYGVRYSPSGALVIPMLDSAGVIHGLQVIRSRQGAKAEHRPEKEFWPQGLAKKGHFHLIGLPTSIVLVAEGYATGATLHAHTMLPVAIAWDAGNMGPVAQALRARYRFAKILLCADDDVFAKCPTCSARLVLAEHPTTCPSCNAEHKRINTGVAAASTAAVAVNGAFVVPRFPDEAARRTLYLERGIKLTDFNDLQMLREGGGGHVVRTQLEATITELGWRLRGAGVTTATAGEGGADHALRPIESTQELLGRYALVYGHGGAVFDRQEHSLVANSDVRDACMSRQLHRAWMEHPDRAIVRKRDVGFDPGEKDPNVTCNLWGGWPTRPAAGTCTKLLELLSYMCSADDNPKELCDWVLRWLAYPIQHPGAKMKTTLVVHGPQGTGKNLLFEVVMGIYGEYGRMIDQAAIEDKFNDWASRKLFLIADEVVARAELFHIKNKLKAFITGDWIRINPKNMAAYEERNHVNLVFLSNESLPVVLDEDDRRHTVIYTPRALPAEFYASVRDELNAGGAAALHDYLLHLDLGEFDEHAKPPTSAAKLALVDQALDSTSRFLYEISDGDIAGMRAMPALSTQIYTAYRAWCQANGYRAAPINKMVAAFSRKHGIEVRRAYYADAFGAIKGPHSFLMLGGAKALECPPEKTQQAWLGACVDAFDAMLKDSRAAA